jgi:hypothetical protein
MPPGAGLPKNREANETGAWLCAGTVAGRLPLMEVERRGAAHAGCPPPRPGLQFPPTANPYLHGWREIDRAWSH